MAGAAAAGDPGEAARGRFDNLTVGRFFAALFVYLHHMMPSEADGLPTGWLRDVFANGYNGVTFFFVLSGFVLAHSYLDEFQAHAPGGWLRFYWKRIARIVPLWLLVSAPYIWYCWRSHDPALLPYLTFTQAWHPDPGKAYGVYAVSWTLSVEMFFYAVFPLIALALRPFRGVRTGPIVMGVGLMFSLLGALYFAAHPGLALLPGTDPRSPQYWLYRFPALRLGDFLVGIGACLTVRRWPRMPAPTWLAGALAGALAALLVRMGFRIGYTPWWTFPDVAIFAAIVLCLAWLDLSGRSVRSRTLILLGEASFAFYLIHVNYMKLVLLPVFVPIAGVHLAQAITLVMTMSTSIGLFLLVESPARRLLTGLATRAFSAARPRPRPPQHCAAAAAPAAAAGSPAPSRPS